MRSRPLMRTPTMQRLNPALIVVLLNETMLEVMIIGMTKIML